MNKTLQKNQNQANFKKNHSPHPTNKKKRRFHPINQDKIGTIFFNSTSQPPFTDPSDPLQPLRTLRTYPTYPTRKASVRFTTRRAKP